MVLAQVVHQLSTDRDFSTRWSINPDGALAERGFLLSQAEIAALTQALHKRTEEILHLADSGPTVNWA